MKIVIIEDSVAEMDLMRKALDKAGHNVLAILVRGKSLAPEIEKVVEANNLLKIVTLVADFGPDKIFLDHSLCMKDFDGEILSLGWDREKLWGTSGSFSQEYCAHHVWGKDRILHSPRFCAALVEAAAK